MIGYVMLGTNNLDQATKFYDTLFAPLGLLHTVGVQSGGTDEGAPVLREEGSDICYAYIRDADGNKLCAFLFRYGTLRTS